VRAVLLLATISLVCLLLLTLQFRGYGAGADDVLAFATTPIQAALARINRTAVGVWSTYEDWKSVRTENIRLREEARQLRIDALRVTEMAEENRRLRRLLALKEALPLATVSGEVIAREWGGWVRSLTVNRGRGDNVTRLTAAITPDGLVGRVVDVRPGASVVQVLTDPASAVGAHVVSSRTPGIVEGDPRGTLRLKYMARDGSGIQVGDLVVTSGAGGVVPRGIPIGHVRAIDDRGSALFHYALLEPAVDFSRLDALLLVVGESDRDLAAAFARGG
jgi:rod shape-determining protein MreC